MQAPFSRFSQRTNTCSHIARTDLTGWLGSRYGSRLPLLIGTAVGSASFVLLLLTYDSRLGIYFASATLGLGIGFAFASMANLVVEAVHPSRTGVATGTAPAGSAGEPALAAE